MLEYASACAPFMGNLSVHSANLQWKLSHSLYFFEAGDDLRGDGLQNSNCLEAWQDNDRQG